MLIQCFTPEVKCPAVLNVLASNGAVVIIWQCKMNKYNNNIIIIMNDIYETHIYSCAVHV